MSDHGRERAIAERRDKPQYIPHEVRKAKRSEVAVIGAVPAGGTPVAPLVGGDDVIARRRQRQHDLPPAISKLGEAVEKQDARPAFRFETRLQHVHREPVDGVDDPGAGAGRKR
jgi:hypothetical protein